MPRVVCVVHPCSPSARYYGFLKAQAPGTYTLFLTSSSGAAGGRCRVNGATLASQAYSGTIATVTSIVSQGSTVCVCVCVFVCGSCTMRLLGHSFFFCTGWRLPIAFSDRLRR